MADFKDREESFERKFAHDATLKFKAEARRNKLLGQWAAKLLNKEGEEADAYVKEVIRADLQEAADDDVFRKLRADFDAANVDKSDHQIRHQMDEFLAQAVAQIQQDG